VVELVEGFESGAIPPGYAGEECTLPFLGTVRAAAFCHPSSSHFVYVPARR
jgi:hypothetical protein